uniref:Uncharacterized protein n=1 Tax=Leersia perrieri TaxID=77586 RepID=A0A0D9WE60_9ORYZ
MVTLEEIRALPPSATRPFYPRALERGTRSLKEPRPCKCLATPSPARNNIGIGKMWELECYTSPRVKYKKRWQQEGNERLDGYSGLSLLTMIKVFQIDGVKEKKTGGLPTMTNNELYKVSDWAWVDQNDFAAMSSAIADGYPLICLYKCGPRLVNLKPGDIYVPPLDGVLGGHASLLVGAHQEGGVKFLYFLTCNSERFCQRNVSEGDGIRGGIGAIIHGRFDFNPVQIFRFNERRCNSSRQVVLSGVRTTPGFG